MFNKILIAASLLICMSATPICCSSDVEPTSGSGEFSKTTSGAKINFGVHYVVSGEHPNKHVDIRNSTSQHLDGCIVFLDASGEVIAEVAAVIPAGGALNVPVPDKAVDQYVTDEVNCGGRGPRPSGSVTEIQPIPMGAHLHQGICLVPDIRGEPNQEHYIRGRARNQAAFALSAEYLVEWGYRTDFSILSGVTDVDAVLSELIVHSGYDMEMTIASNMPFEDVDVLVNGIHILSTDDGFRPPTIGAGWDALTFAIPARLPELNYDPSPGASWENEVEFRFTRPADAAVYELSRKVEYTSD